jgi:AcrR family transcriptional regulator
MSQGTMDDLSNEAPGLRERKRRETLDRIGEVGLSLFASKGYEATTLEDIAMAAGISRRTFFYYYKSKDDILVALQCEGFIQALRHAFDDLEAGVTPFQAMRDSLPRLVSSFETEQTLVISEILDSSESLKARKLAVFVEMEEALGQALSKVWPAPTEKPGLRLLSSLGLGVMRLASDEWRKDPKARSLSDHVRDGFALLERQLGR